MSRFTNQVSSRPRAFALAALGALTTAALLASPAVASAGQLTAAPVLADGPQTNVYYTLQDLSTDEGTRALYRRIQLAAEMVCPTYDWRDLEAAAASKECQRQAIAGAVAHIGNARLAAVYAHTVMRHG